MMKRKLSTDKHKADPKTFTEGMCEEYDLRPGSMKSRTNYRVGICVNKIPCKNEPEKCKYCIKKEFYKSA